VSGAGFVGATAQVVVMIAGAPLLTGLMRQVRARLEGRAGAGVGQPWRDLRKLARKEGIGPAGTGPVFRAAPSVLLGTACVAAAVVPLASLASPLDSGVDLFALVAVLALGTVALVLAGLDTGTAFGGMGASREITVLALVEPTILLAVFALSVPVGTTNLAAIVAAAQRSSTRELAPVSLLAAVALGVVIIAETGRLPVDNPSTHLELTMIHEAMVLEYAGPDLALVELAGAVRLAVLLGLFASLFLPWGLTAGLVGLPVALVLLVVKVAALGALLAAGEVFAAKLRLFRVPELLAGSFLLALLAVVGSYFLTAGGLQ
jgi:formate hydrogenlyase subunit 4